MVAASAYNSVGEWGGWVENMKRGACFIKFLLPYSILSGQDLTSPCRSALTRDNDPRQIGHRSLDSTWSSRFGIWLIASNLTAGLISWARYTTRARRERDRQVSTAKRRSKMLKVTEVNRDVCVRDPCSCICACCCCCCCCCGCWEKTRRCPCCCCCRWNAYHMEREKKAPSAWKRTSQTISPPHPRTSIARGLDITGKGSTFTHCAAFALPSLLLFLILIPSTPPFVAFFLVFLAAAAAAELTDLGRTMRVRYSDKSCLPLARTLVSWR